MTKPVKTFVAKIVDEYGGLYPAALVAVRQFSESSQRTGVSETCEGTYTIKPEVEAIAYKLNYWYDQGKRTQYRSRPLVHENEEGEFTEVFTVDLSNPQIENALNSSNDVDQNILTAIELDVRARFK